MMFWRLVFDLFSLFMFLKYILLQLFIAGSGRRGGLMVSVLDLDWAARVRDLAGDIVLCSWAKHFTLTVPLSTQVYKWVPEN